MTEKLRITRVRRGRTKSGKVVAELRTANTRLEYPELRLFDLAALQAVGIDPNQLTDEDTYCQFWANYELSEKTTSKGTPYRDIVSLEAIDAPATTTSTDSTALLGELRAIKALLLELAASSEQSRSLLARLATLPPLPAGPAQVAQAARIKKLNSATDHVTVPDLIDTPAGINTTADPQATDPHLPEPHLPEPEARQAFYGLLGPAIAEGRITPQAGNAFIGVANGDGWNGALAALQEHLAKSD